MNKYVYIDQPAKNYIEELLHLPFYTSHIYTQYSNKLVFAKSYLNNSSIKQTILKIVLLLMIAPITLLLGKVRTFSRRNCKEINLNKEEASTAKTLLDLYHKKQAWPGGGGWVIATPLTAPSVAMAGSIGFEGNGIWKIHVSINPSKMDLAIQIIAKILLGNGAPRLGFKMQNESAVEATHQIGKQLALLFTKAAEDQAIAGNKTEIKNLLTRLAKEFHQCGITPEDGLVLTTETMEAVDKLDDSFYEKRTNYRIAKFDRKIPCIYGDFFHYRAEEDYEDENFPTAESIFQIARTEPQFAHNPQRQIDPFIDLTIN